MPRISAKLSGINFVRLGKMPVTDDTACNNLAIIGRERLRVSFCAFGNSSIFCQDA